MPWDPLRESIGVTLGDMILLGPQNVLVEGVTDQILLANVSSRLKQLELSHIDLERINIVPYDDEHALRFIIAKVRGRGAKAIVLADSDDQGKRIQKLCQREGIAFVPVGAFSDRSDCDAAIEDVVGIGYYVASVNEFYRRFDWFTPLEPGDIVASIAKYSISRYINQLFAEQFGSSLGKVEVATQIADNIENMPEETMARFQALIQALIEGLV